MIRIKIEMVPHGVEADTYTIAEGRIINDGTGTLTRGNYTYSLSHKGRVYRSGGVKNFPRKTHNVWKLLIRVLWEAFGGD